MYHHIMQFSRSIPNGGTVYHHTGCPIEASRVERFTGCEIHAGDWTPSHLRIIREIEAGWIKIHLNGIGGMTEMVDAILSRPTQRFHLVVMSISQADFDRIIAGPIKLTMMEIKGGCKVNLDRPLPQSLIGLNVYDYHAKFAFVQQLERLPRLRRLIIHHCRMYRGEANWAIWTGHLIRGLHAMRKLSVLHIKLPPYVDGIPIALALPPTIKDAYITQHGTAGGLAYDTDRFIAGASHPYPALDYINFGYGASMDRTRGIQSRLKLRMREKAMECACELVESVEVDVFALIVGMIITHFGSTDKKN